MITRPRPHHPQIQRLLDGEITLADLPPDLTAEGRAALRLLEGVDRTRPALSDDLDERVMAAVRRHAASRTRRAWRWLGRPREIRLRVRPWVLGPALAAAAALVVLLARPGRRDADAPPATAVAAESVFVRFVLYAPDARQVALAGTFNQWDALATPLVPGTDASVWSATVAVPVGQHQYAFVIDGARWVPDPAAPQVDDGFGRANSVLSVVPGGRTL